MTTLYRLFLLGCLVLPLSAATHDSVDEALAAWKAWSDGQIDIYQSAVDVAQRIYGAEKTKLDAAAIGGLIAVGKREARKPDKAVALSAWTEVLRLDESHSEATAFFTALGQLEQVRAALSPSAAPTTDLLGNAPAATAPPALPEAVQSEVRKRDDGLTKARGVFAKAEGAARTRFREAEAKARTKAVKDLGALAQKADRGGDLPGATAAWKGVLQLDREDTRARVYFTGLGRLDALLAELPVVRDPLGDLPDPDRGFAPLSLRGLTVLITGSDKPERRGPFEQALHEHCAAAGMVVTSASVDSLVGDKGDALLKDKQLVILAGGLSDATRHSCIGVMRNLRAPVVVTDLALAEISGLIGRPAYNGHLTEYTDSILIKAGAHPLAAGLAGSVRILDPLPASGPVKAVPIEQDPDLLKVYVPKLDMPPGAVVVAGLAADRSAGIIAFDTGHPVILGESKAGEAVTAKLPARRLGFWMLNQLRPDQTKRLSRDFWRLWDANLTWALRGTIAPPIAPSQR